ncbi:MAG: hypothetical protein MJE68_12220 [Proteobacteria bacterium]|nr:hypothetical protein [Pseudomonadota bacterium]
MDHKPFRMMLAKQLIGDYMSRKRPGRPQKRSRPTPHLPSHSKSKRCVYCRDVRSPPRRKESGGSAQPVSVIHNFASPVNMTKVIDFVYGMNNNYVFSRLL